MDTQPSEATMRLVRARARLDTTYGQLTATATLDAERWARLESRLSSALFDPALAGTADEDHALEAQRLANNLLAAIARLVRHLESWEGTGGR